MDTYLSVDGYQAWQKILEEKTPAADIIDTVKESALRGRGGAGFPTGLKWSFMPGPHRMQKYILCNSDESEPGTCKDRDILRFNPHAVDRGNGHCGLRDGRHVGYNYLRGEFHHEPFERFEQALKEAYEAGLLGRDIRGSGIDMDIHAALGAGAYICGEETALMESLEGKKGQPQASNRRSRPISVCTGCTSTINNTEDAGFGPGHHAKRLRMVPAPGQTEQRRAQMFLGIRSRRPPRQLRRCAWARRSPNCSKPPAACARDTA